MKNNKRWANHYDKCVKCGTVDRLHCAHGMCKRCYSNNSYGSRIAHNDKIYRCILCGKEFAISYYTSKSYDTTRRFCSKSCATKYQAAKYYNRDKLIDDIKIAINDAGRYMTTAEICYSLNISSKTLTKYRISIISVNKMVGMKKTISTYGDVCYIHLQKLFDNIVREKTFDDCISPKGYKLKFDFYVNEYNLLIETDGEQHYNKNHRYYSDYSIKCDRIKDNWASSNGYTLIRLRYKYRVTEEYIANILSRYNINLHVL